jgi:thiamine kinase-like enzyme
MNQVELKGHSGCKIFLMYENEKKSFVRKISKNIKFNKRLKKQCEKQILYKSQFAFTPKVLNEGDVGGLYFFDMEYVRGISLDTFVPTCSAQHIQNISEILINIILENKKRKHITQDKKYIFDKKIRSISDQLQEESTKDPVKTTLKVLSSHSWDNLEDTSCHGDFTLENIILSTEGNYYLIDFLDSFYESWIGDISKVMQDLLVGWSYRNNFSKKDISENAKLKYILLSRQFANSIDTKIKNNKLWEDIYYLLLLDLLRVIPYIVEKNTYDFVIKSLDTIVNNIEKGALYEHINCSMCWPVYEISKR